MRGSAFLLAFLSLPLLGLSSWAFPPAARLPLAARLALAAGAGALLLAFEMFLFHLLGIPWSLPALAAPLLLFSAVGLWRWRSLHTRPENAPTRRAWPALLLAALALLLAAYAAGTARATSVDLLLFWGPKGLRFAAARGLDVAFLTNPENRLMHVDYPPLLPFLYAWGTLAAGRMAWGAALLTMPICLFFAALGFWGFARETLPARRAAERTALFAAVLSYGCVVSLTAGNAEPLLLFFESVALAALTFGKGRGEMDWIAGAALAGVVWTKVEGAAFAAILIGSFLLLERERGRRMLALMRLAILPAAFLGLWLAWAARQGLAEAYRSDAYGSFSLARWREVLSAFVANADYGIAYLPWVLLLLLIALGPSPRRALPLAAAAAGYVLFILYSYLHGEFDPSEWIRWSAKRLLLTPLLCLLFAGAAAATPSEAEALAPQPGAEREGAEALPL